MQIIRKLKEYGIVKNVKKSDRQSMLSDLVEEDIRVQISESGERELYYVFSYCWSNCCIWTGIKVLS